MIWVLVKRIISYQEKAINRKGEGEREMDREKVRDTKEESERYKGRE